MFGSNTVPRHLARGVIGFGAFAIAVHLADGPGAASVVGSTILAVGGLIALRGCPVCWTVGMFETLNGRRSEVENSLHAAAPTPSNAHSRG